MRTDFKHVQIGMVAEYQSIGFAVHIAWGKSNRWDHSVMLVARFLFWMPCIEVRWGENAMKQYLQGTIRPQ